MNIGQILVRYPSYAPLLPSCCRDSPFLPKQLIYEKCKIIIINNTKSPTSKELEITKPPPHQVSLSLSLPLSLSLDFYMEKPRKSLKDRLSKFLLRSACSNTTASTRPFKRLPRNPQPDIKTGKLERHLSFPSHSDRPIIQISIDCAGRRSVDAALPSVKCKKKKERRLTETGVLYETGDDREGRKCPPASPFSPSNCVQKHQYLSKSERKDKEITKKLFYKGYTISSSSSVGSENDKEPEFFSSDREKQELISSRSFSFSSESSDFYQHKRSLMRENRCYKKGIEEVAMEEEEESGFAVVKRSTDPYKDFRNSMVEMILERRIKGADDMRRLLESYLELNSPEHHPTIISAFADVWDASFPKS